MSTGFIGEHNQHVLPAVEGAAGPDEDKDSGAPTSVIAPVGETEAASASLTAPTETISTPEIIRPIGSRRRRVLREIGVYAMFVAIAYWVTNQYWMGGHVTATDISDQAFFEIMLSHGAWAVSHLQNPLFMTQLNAPVGVNMMANTSVLAFSLPLAPLTLWLGPGVSFAFMMTFGLAATAAAWYHVLSRHIVTSRSAAIIGGVIAGFGPGMVSHANGHPNIVAQFLLPFIAWRTVRLREPGRAVRNGLALALLVVFQFFINEELLFLTALALALVIGGYAVAKRRVIRPEILPFVKGAAVTLGIASVLLAYPLWYQFTGPVTYHGLNSGVKTFSTDLESFPAFASRTAFGTLTRNKRLSLSVAEENSFFGWPLLLAVGVTVYWLRRSLLVRILGITALVLSVLSLGQSFVINGHHTKVPAPWRLFLNLPLFDTAVPTRITLLVLPIVAVLMALGHDRAMALRRSAPIAGVSRPRTGQALVAWCALLGIAIVGIVPTSIPTVKLAPAPAFFATGEWRSYVPSSESILVVPVPQPGAVDAMFWQAQQGLGFSLSNGYFLGPDPSQNNVAMFGAPPRPTVELLADVEKTDVPAVIHTSDRLETFSDLQYWHTAVIVLLPNDPSEIAMRESISDLIGIKPKFVGGVWLWDVRSMVASPPTANLD